MSILVTGGAGYIGSHTCVELLNAGFEVVVVDNLSNSHPDSVKTVQEITRKPLTFYKLDLSDRDALEKVFAEQEIDAVIHLAGLKAVGESVSFPIKYYHNNLTSTLILLEVMQHYDVTQLVFSSSATVYGLPDHVPIPEDASLRAKNPYGRTKLMIEEILLDQWIAEPEWSISILRYFNPIGAHESGEIGESPNGIPNNLLPFISQVAVGRREALQVYGNDYDTPDGTGIRDFIHVVDLAKGHLKALSKVMSGTGIEPYNLGTGIGYSVLEVVEQFSKVTGVEIPYIIKDRRPGDISTCYADPEKAKRELGWVAEKNLEDMCRDAWRWQISHPNGYE